MSPWSNTTHEATVASPMVWLMSKHSMRCRLSVKSSACCNDCQPRLLVRLLAEALRHGQARVGERHFHPHPALAGDAPADLHLVARLLAQQGLQCFAVKRLADENLARHRLTEVMLLQERLKRRCGVVLVGITGEKALVAQMSPAPHHHQVDAHHALLFIAGDDVRIRPAAAADVLLFLHPAQGPDLVAVQRSFLVTELLRRQLHFFGDGFHHLLVLALHEQRGIVHIGTIALRIDQTHAGRGAALDLVQQAGARAVAEHAVLAGAQAEHLLQQLDALLDRAGIGKGAEILVALVLRAAIVAEPRESGAR